MIFWYRDEGLEYSQSLSLMGKETDQGQIKGLGTTMKSKNYTFVREALAIWLVVFLQQHLASRLQECKIP